MLYPKFFHVRMAGRVNEIGMRTREARPDLLKQNHLGVYIHLFIFAQGAPPMGEFLRKFHFPFHRWNIVCGLYYVKGEPPSPIGQSGYRDSQPPSTTRTWPWT
jgi:hypothetical protein